MVDRIVAQGRDADVYDAGPGRVRRRFRDGRSQRDEATLIAHVRRHGYPAPDVHAVSADGADVVMARLDGPTMLDDLGRRPWRLRVHAATLARLHRDLGRVPAPPGLPPAPVPGPQVVHLDLHPGNVMLTGAGPVVIDWTNARAGDPAVDVAVTWLLVACAESGTTGPRAVVERALRRAFLRAFLAHVDRDAAAAVLPSAAEWKTADRNTRPIEADAMLALSRHHASG